MTMELSSKQEIIGEGRNDKFPWVWSESPVILVSGSKSTAGREGGEPVHEVECCSWFVG